MTKPKLEGNECEHEESLLFLLVRERDANKLPRLCARLGLEAGDDEKRKR